jgi:hypothetical protein
MRRIKQWSIVVVTGISAFILIVLFLNKEKVTYKAPPFPKQINGKSIRWIPDIEKRRAIVGVQPEDVINIEIRGCGRSGIPTDIYITDKNLIRKLIVGISKAVRLSNQDKIVSDKTGAAPPGFIMYPEDSLRIYIQLNNGIVEERSFSFLADHYEERDILSASGTLSPEFQDALRACRVPPQPPKNAMESFLVYLSTRSL